MNIYTFDELKTEIIKKYGSDFVGRNDNTICRNGIKVIIENDAENTIVFQGEEYNCEPGWLWISGKTFINGKISIDVFYAAFQYLNSDKTKEILNVIELDKILGI